MTTRFTKVMGDVNAAAKSSGGDQVQSQQKTDADDVKTQFWQEAAEPERVATIRLNFDISVELDDRLKAKARDLRTSKTALVRRMIEFMLDD